MAALPDIRRISILQNVGVFHDYRHAAEVPDFKRYNLVYGFNGTGKTTISRVLRSLDGGDLSSVLPTGGRVELELSDGRVITLDQNTDALQRRVLVFNVDFINENLRWSEGRANPVFYIGREASRRAELLERIERRIPVRDGQRQRAQADHSARERALSTFQTNAARMIAEMLGLGRQYDARHLKQDYESGEVARYKPLSDQEREDRRRLIQQPSAYDKLNPPELDAQALKAASHQARRIAETTISGMTLQAMQQHPSMIPWLKTGFDYHREHNLDSCIFCGNDIADSRLNSLQSALDERLDRLFVEIKEAADKLHKAQELLRTFPLVLPGERALSATLSRDYRGAMDQLKRSISYTQEKLDRAAAAVGNKGEFPNTSTWPDDLNDDKEIGNAIEALRVDSEKIRGLIDRHNDEQDRFVHRQTEARQELKLALLIEYAEEHETLRRDLHIAAQALELRKRLHAKLVGWAAGLRNEVGDHGPAVARINTLLHAYLGHNEIHLEVFEEGYQIVRNGQAIISPLSEGERTAIALCYFLSKLQEEGRSLSEQIIVVDDPVSSLDAGALNYAFNLLKGMLQNAQQLIVFTHNLAFMNETKKWLRKPRKEGRASFLYLRTWHDQEQDRRQATIVEMPKLLRGYDSEYQYSLLPRAEMR